MTRVSTFLVSTFLVSTFLVLVLTTALDGQPELLERPREVSLEGGLTSETVDLVMERQAAGVYHAPERRQPHTLPVVFHIVRDSQGGITHPDGWHLDQRILEAMWHLNNHYGSSGMQFCQAGPPLYIDSDFWAEWEPGATMEELLQIDWVEGAINVYLYPEPRWISSVITHTWSPIQSTGLNFASFNGWGSDNRSLSRVVSYYFDLFKTDEDRFGIECASGSNCEVAGDLVCDTPTEALHLVNPQCEWRNPPPYQGPCPGDPMYTPDKENIMSKRINPCVSHLTQGQQDRAYATLVNIRHELSRTMCNCPADCDLNGVLDINDYFCFLDAFEERDPYACDIGMSTGTRCDIFDFVAFQDAFVAGCP